MRRRWRPRGGDGWRCNKLAVVGDVAFEEVAENIEGDRRDDDDYVFELVVESNRREANAQRDRSRKNTPVEEAIEKVKEAKQPNEE